ncbi:MAG TPA: hypothetical protein VJM49_20575, partial [Acidimicrobiales bacterium]|nr:hypothetical protein [Acidimicrobiales bacterium]
PSGPPRSDPPPSGPPPSDPGAAVDEPDDGGGDTRRRRLATALVGLVVIAALVLSLVMVRDVSSGDDDGSAAPPTTEPEPATEAEIEAEVAEISDFVATARGAEFLAPVDVQLEGEGDFQDRLLEDFDEDADQLRTTEVFLEGLGLVDPDVDLVESMRALLGGGVVGFYDPETAELVVRGAALTPYVRTTIAHELVHALDDQHHDLDRPEYDEADDEIGFGFSAVVEGNARRVEDAYRASLSDDEQEQATAEELSLGADIDLGDIPLVLVDMIGAPYSLGQRLVEDVVDRGGEPAVDAAFADPPRTSEQVLDPERYAAREPAVSVPHPQVPGEVVDEGVLGELLVLLVLADDVGTDEARAAAEGWGGDWAVAWRDGDRSCVTAVLVGDDPAETDEMRAAFDTWAAEHEATVTPGAAGQPFTVESCAG